MEQIDIDDGLRRMISAMSPEQVADLVDSLPPEHAAMLLHELGDPAATLPASPLAMAQHVMPDFADLPHLRYISDRIKQAVEDVENGEDRRLIIEMPPRSGKSLLATQIAALWMLATHPSWPILLTSYSGKLATIWGRQIRRWIDAGLAGSHLQIAADAGAAADWETTDGGSLRSRSIREALTGLGAKVLVIDDPLKDHAEAHSKNARNAVWDWWQSVAQTRLHPPSLVIVIMTRWHEDDLVGRLLNPAIDGGDPEAWEVIRLPALAESDDVLGRAVGDPIFSPMVKGETQEAALKRWEKVKRSVGGYTWSALYQQRPAPAEGAIFTTDWWRYWTTDPAHLDPDDPDRVRLVKPEDLEPGNWLDSWDLTFDKSETSDFVVGQRWAKVGANRFLVAQQRARMNFTEMLAAMTVWAGRDPVQSPHGRFVHKRLVEKKASGAAAITTLRDKIAGLKPVIPTASKEVRARAITPEIESGNVYLPHPGMPGYKWVLDLVNEARDFPHGEHDDQVDALTQALFELRDGGGATVTVPGRTRRAESIPKSRVAAAATLRRT